MADTIKQSEDSMFVTHGSSKTAPIKKSREHRSLKVVRPTPGSTPARGFITVGSASIACVLGPAGAVWRKEEGDYATPRGAFSLLFGRYRADRLSKPVSLEKLTPIRQADIWCDDPSTFRYNQPGKAPVRNRHERLWRDSPVYDIILMLDYNLRPRRLGRGSAIFFHLTEDYRPTAGCIAIKLNDMRKVLSQISKAALVRI